MVKFTKPFFSLNRFDNSDIRDYSVNGDLVRAQLIHLHAITHDISKSEDAIPIVVLFKYYYLKAYGIEDKMRTEELALINKRLISINYIIDGDLI